MNDKMPEEMFYFEKVLFCIKNSKFWTDANFTGDTGPLNIILLIFSFKI